MTNRIIKRIILLTAMPLFLYSCHSEKPKEDIKESYVLSDKILETTTFAKAQLHNVENELRFFGTISADNSKLIEVYPVVGGNVTQVFVELGDYVKKGDLLATIKSTEVAEYERELEDAKNDLIVAKNNLRLTQELFQGKLNSERDVIVAQSEYDKAESQQHRLEEIYQIYHIKNGSIYEVRAPIEGFIIQKDINKDMLLRSDRTNNIFDIADIKDVWAIANVNESDINQVRVNMKATVTTISYPDTIFEGKIDKIFNIIDPDTKAMKVQIDLHNPNFLLKPDMRASIKISYTEDTKMVEIPSSAVIFDKGRNFVMIYKDRNNIETRAIEVFRQVGEKTFVSSGLAEGETVITKNQLLIYDQFND